MPDAAQNKMDLDLMLRAIRDGNFPPEQLPPVCAALIARLSELEEKDSKALTVNDLTAAEMRMGVVVWAATLVAILLSWLGAPAVVAMMLPMLSYGMVAAVLSWRRYRATRAQRLDVQP